MASVNASQTDDVVGAVQDKLQELGPENVIAFVCETVVGATAGVLPPVPGYLRRIREICDRHGVLLILDEVMCGMGRTGHLYACEEDGVAPDLLAIAKRPAPVMEHFTGYPKVARVEMAGDTRGRIALQSASLCVELGRRDPQALFDVVGEALRVHSPTRGRY